MERHDLDGKFVYASCGKTAIIINGLCRAIDNDLVKDSLFGSDIDINPLNIEGIAVGPSLNDGSCLIQGDEMLDIFLLTGLPHTQRHLISNYETFKKLNFDISRVRSIPWLALQATPIGNIITSRL